jgi:glycosyltransferase involved in cell wall biosynthesis
MSEIINDGKDVFLVTPKNKNLLKNKILEILSLSESDELSLSEKNKILNKSSVKYIVSEMISFYEEVIDNKNEF